jgi:low affinity Fe/Cu permease
MEISESWSVGIAACGPDLAATALMGTPHERQTCAQEGLARPQLKHSTVSPVMPKAAPHPIWLRGRLARGGTAIAGGMAIAVGVVETHEEQPAMGKRQGSFSDRFRDFANQITAASGTPWAMAAAALLILAWAVTGPIFGFSDTWQLVINTTTTIITFLMVFIIQTSANREAKALHLKLDELIWATPKARNRMMNEENLTERQLEADEEEARKKGGARAD